MTVALQLPRWYLEEIVGSLERIFAKPKLPCKSWCLPCAMNGWDPVTHADLPREGSSKPRRKRRKKL